MKVLVATLGFQREEFSKITIMGIFIIAEAGVNHNGSMELALKLIDAAKSCGANAVKFQTFHAESVVSSRAKKAEYQKLTTNGKDSQFEMIKNLELGERDHVELIDHCRRIGIDFLSSPFDEGSADMLDRLGIERYKIGSGEVTNLPFLKFLAGKGKPLILSTGMSTLAEVQEAVTAIKGAGNERLTLLHCVTEYPAPFEQVNLLAMKTLESYFHLPIGYSDHTDGIEVAIAAVALGAAVIEKHLTLDRSMPGPDHRASLEPAMFKEMIGSIRRVEVSMGDGNKTPAPCELKNILIARKSIVASRDIKKGEVLGRECLAIKRPGDGIAPKHLDEVVGMIAKEDILCDEAVVWEKIT